MSSTILPVRDERVTRYGGSERYEFSMTRCGFQSRGISISRNVKGTLYLVAWSGQVICYDDVQIGFGGSCLGQSDESERGEWHRQSFAKASCWSAMGRISRDYAIAFSPIAWYRENPFVSDLNAHLGDVGVTIAEEGDGVCLTLSSRTAEDVISRHEGFSEAIWATELWAEEEGLIEAASHQTCYLPRWAWPLMGKATTKRN